MNLYRKLSEISFLKDCYAYKFLFVAFIGIHIPLIGLLFFVIYGGNSFSNTSILIFTLVMTLIATAATLSVLRQLIKPIELASNALDEYRNHRILSVLPEGFTDEAGTLLTNIQKSMDENEKYIIDKQDLIYLLSHDLRTFAGNSQSLAELILDENPSDSIKELTELIYQSTSQQFDFIETFIKLIKDEDEISKKGLHTKKIKLAAVLAHAEDQVAQQLTIKNIKLSSSIEIEEVNLSIEKDLLIRVLVNLIDNAIKFSFPDSEIKIRVGLEKAKVFFTITDNGLGFDPNKREELFEKFTKMSKLGTANEPSTGIGLYLCRKIITKYQGEISAVSEGKNKGASFSIVFEDLK